MRLHGRSSSHFTRITRIFARELEVELEFLPIRNLMSTDAAEFGGNPALKLPTLESPDGRWFGSLPICRELARHSELNLDIVWPEQLETALASNVQEMVTTAMSSEVLLVLGKGKEGAEESGYQAKLRAGLLGTMAWLEENAGPAFSSLPAERDLSYVEVSLFCLMEHLPFREVLDTEAYPKLRGFAERFARRSSAKATPYRFDFQ
jgi:glutathione S-transferase